MPDRRYTFSVFKPGTDESNVQMSDILCDFCHREWTEEIPFIEGHRGRMICGNCLALGYREVIVAGKHTGPGTDSGTGFAPYTCALCRESDDDRAAMDRAGEIGWRSPLHEDAAVCARCLRQAAGKLHKDPDSEWRKPVVPDATGDGS